MASIGLYENDTLPEESVLVVENPNPDVYTNFTNNSEGYTGEYIGGMVAITILLVLAFGFPIVRYCCDKS